MMRTITVLGAALCLAVAIASCSALSDVDGVVDVAFLQMGERVEEDVAAGIETEGFDDTDGVDNIIDSLVNDVKSGNTAALGGAKATVLANSNILNHKEANRNGNFEEKLKKTKEEDRKTKREDFKKRRMEESQKTLESKAKARVAAQKKAMIAKQIEQEKEEDKKQVSEEKAKTNEENAKKAYEKKTKATVKAAKAKAAKEEEAARAALAKEQQDEENKKSAMEKANKASIREIKQKAKAKRVAAERSAKAGRMREKKRKESEAKSEAAKKKKEMAAEAAKKKQEADAPGKWQNCRSVRVYFNQNHAWHQCPAGSLVTGIYRGGGDQMDSIYYLRCCEPTTGSRTLEVSACQNTNWVSSFDRRGWSYCPKDTYIQGFYKSSCNWIYCLEYAKCCSIAGGRGYKHCRPTFNK